MLCYKDRTWCSMGILCGNDSCSRKLTNEDIEKAENLGLSFSFSNLKTDDCGFIEIKKD